MRFLLRALWALLTGRTMLPVRMFNGHTGVLHLLTGRVLPALQGADDDDSDDADADTDADDDAADDVDDSDDAADDTDDTDDDANPEDALPDNVKAILKKERDLRRAAEKREKAAKRKLRLGAKPPVDKPKPDASKKDDTPDPGASVTAKLQRANLKAALADEGITGKAAKAALRLLDGVEYDDDDEPTNLEDVLEEAEEIYGSQLIRGTSTEDDDSGDGKSPKRKAPKVNGGSGNQGGGKGPRLTADELAAAKKAGMTPEKYEAMRGVTSLADYQAVQKKLNPAAK